MWILFFIHRYLCFKMPKVHSTSWSTGSSHSENETPRIRPMVHRLHETGMFRHLPIANNILSSTTLDTSVHCFLTLRAIFNGLMLNFIIPPNMIMGPGCKLIVLYLPPKKPNLKLYFSDFMNNRIIYFGCKFLTLSQNHRSLKVFPKIDIFSF